jgi:hypothetical protein
MTDHEIIRMMHEHFTGLFPKVCRSCGRCFATLREYILDTRPLWPTISYDAEQGDWEPTQPIGTFALANCPCDNTLALSTEGMPLSKRHSALKWVLTETKRRGLSPVELTDYVRDEIRKRALGKIGTLP